MPRLPTTIDGPALPTLHNMLLMYPKFAMYWSIYIAANMVTAWVGNYIVYRLEQEFGKK